MPPRKPEQQHVQVRAVPGEPTCFEVRSRSHPNGCSIPGEAHSGWYRIELREHKGCGECSCIRWRTVSWPRIRDTGNLPPSMRCSHVKASREVYCNRKLAEEPPFE